MSETLSPQSEALVEAQLRSGRYTRRSDVIEAGLQLLQRDAERADRRAEVREAVERGIADANAGRVAPADVEQLLREARKRRG